MLALRVGCYIPSISMQPSVTTKNPHLHHSSLLSSRINTIIRTSIRLTILNNSSHVPYLRWSWHLQLWFRTPSPPGKVSVEFVPWFILNPSMSIRSERYFHGLADDKICDSKNRIGGTWQADYVGFLPTTPII